MPTNEDVAARTRSVLTQTLDSDEQIDNWLNATNRYLGGARPVELLCDGGERRVLGAVEAFVEGLRSNCR
jgi:hypothetical protein